MNEKILIPSIFGEEIGVLLEGRNGVSFQYSSSFNAEKYPISPLRLPYDINRVFNYYDSMPFDGLPGIFADSLPDSFGNIAMREYFRRKYRKTQVKLSVLEKLAYIGSNGIGAIEYTPADNHNTYDVSMDLQRYADETRHLVEGNAEDVLNELLAHPSPGGARPKASVLWQQKDNSICMGEKPKEGYEPWIVKFDEEGREETKLEFVYMSMAKEVGIAVPEFKHIAIADEIHFASKRFDRIDDMHTKLHQATLAALIHGDFMRQNACTYEEYLRISEGLTKSPSATKEAFRRMVFNVIGKNCDDHIKNFSFLMDKKGEWRLSPAYDLLYSFGPVTYGEHKMSINGKNANITLDDLAQCGYSAGLEKRFMKETIDHISDSFSQVDSRLQKGGLSATLTQEIVREVKPIQTNNFPNEKRGVKRGQGKKGR